jgi:hypothetical protein
MSDFMRPEIFFDECAAVVDTCQGIQVIPSSVCGDRRKQLEEELDHAELMEILGDYLESGTTEIYSVEIQAGYLARMQAPGYLDCTGWTIHPTEKAARRNLREMYQD